MIWCGTLTARSSSGSGRSALRPLRPRAEDSKARGSARTRAATATASPAPSEDEELVGLPVSAVASVMGVTGVKVSKRR